MTTSDRPRRPGRALALAGVLAAGATAAAAAPASAAPFQCSANALSGTVLGQPLNPVAANPQGSPCQDASAGLPGVLPPPLSTSAVFAQTALAGPTDKPYEQVAAAQAGIADLNVAALPDLPIQLPTAQISDALSQVTVPVSGALAPLLAPLGVSELKIDLRPAIDDLLPDGKLPDVSVLGVRAAYAAAAARCVDGRAVLDGGTTLAGVTVLGQELPTDTVASQAVNLIDTESIDLSKLDLSKIELPAGLSFTTPVIGDLLKAAVQPVLDALPPIEIPATVAQVKLTPGSETRNGDSLLETGPRVQVSIAGQSVADLSIGAAAVQATGVDCTPPAPPAQAMAPPAQQALACTNRRVVLTDVRQRGNVINFEGAAGKADAGKTVRFFSQADGKVVQTATVAPDGTFDAKTRDLPPKRLRFTNKARYEARISKDSSRNLKLRRRLQITSQRVDGDKVTFQGRISLPRADRQAPIIIKRRISCASLKKIGEVKPDSKGRFKVTLNGSGDKGQAAFFRLQSKVPATRSNPKLFDTYTLPHGVNVAQ